MGKKLGRARSQKKYAKEDRKKRPSIDRLEDENLNAHLKRKSKLKISGEKLTKKAPINTVG